MGIVLLYRISTSRVWPESRHLLNIPDDADTDSRSLYYNEQVFLAQHKTISWDINRNMISFTCTFDKEALC